MKLYPNTDIHESLPLAEMRELITQEIWDDMPNPMSIKKREIPFPKGLAYKSAIDRAAYHIQEAEAAIEYEQKRKEFFQKMMGYHQIMQSQGWKEYDTEEITEGRTGIGNFDKWPCSFIGSEEEWQQRKAEIKAWNEKNGDEY